MKKILYSAILILSCLMMACDKKVDDSVKTDGTLLDTTGIQGVAEDTLDEFEYEADSVEMDDDEDI
jgi:hypothetical protein